MTAPRILAIDQGTTSSRALVVDHEGRVIGAGQRLTPARHPRPGWVEQDAEALWQATEAAIAIALGSAQVSPGEITAIGIANQRETVVAWDRGTGEPSAPAIGWQDRRTLDRCAELEAAGHGPAVRAATGLAIDPYFSATKIAWLLDNVPDLRRRSEAGDIAVGTVDSWLAWKLTSGARHVTDYTNASRTLLFNTGRGRWDSELCSLFGIPREILPTPQPSASPFGHTSIAAFGAEVPILAIAGDQQAALYGQACFQPGMVKNTYGTGCFLLANAGRRSTASTNGLLVSLGPGTSTKGPEYVIEGSVFVAGAGIRWLQEQLGLASEAEIEALARSVSGSDGVEFVPAFAGLGAPHWDPAAKGAIVGLSLGTTRAHIARAALESIALASADVLTALGAELGAPVTELRVDGGAAADDLLMQMQADFSRCSVVRPAQTETTAMGAAYLAGLQAGIWASLDEISTLWRAERRFEPAISEAARAERLGRWHEAVERTRSRG